MERPHPRGGPKHAVFVDDTGRRARRAQRLYRTVAVLCLGSLVLLVVSLLNGVPLPGLTRPVPLPSNEPVHPRGEAAAPPQALGRAAGRRSPQPSPVAVIRSRAASDPVIAAGPGATALRGTATPSGSGPSAGGTRSAAGPAANGTTAASPTPGRRTTPAPAASSPGTGRHTTPAPASSPGGPPTGRHTTPPVVPSPSRGRHTTPPPGRHTTPATGRHTTPATGRHTTPPAAPTTRPSHRPPRLL